LIDVGKSVVFSGCPPRRRLGFFLFFLPKWSRGPLITPGQYDLAPPSSAGNLSLSLESEFSLGRVDPSLFFPPFPIAALPAARPQGVGGVAFDLFFRPQRPFPPPQMRGFSPQTEFPVNVSLPSGLPPFGFQGGFFETSLSLCPYLSMFFFLFFFLAGRGIHVL